MDIVRLGCDEGVEGGRRGLGGVGRAELSVVFPLVPDSCCRWRSLVLHRRCIAGTKRRERAGLVVLGRGGRTGMFGEGARTRSNGAGGVDGILPDER